MLEAAILTMATFGREAAAQADHAAGGASAFFASTITFWSGLNFTSFRFSATVLPVTVMQSPCQQARVQQDAHQHGHAARLPHVLGDIFFRQALSEAT